jgi:hypothetical protein
MSHSPAMKLEEKMAGLSPEHRQKIQGMAKQLIAEETTLRDLRRAMALTQERLADQKTA